MNQEMRVFGNCLRIGDSITLYLGKGDLHITSRRWYY